MVVCVKRHQGEIKQVSGGYGLIEYVPVRQRTSRGKICEWFHLPGFSSLDKGKLPVSGTINDSTRFQVRPSPPQNVGSKTKQIYNCVDQFYFSCLLHLAM